MIYVYPQKADNTMKLPREFRELESRLQRVADGHQTDGDRHFWNQFRDSFLYWVLR